MKKDLQKGFTLIELIVSTAILVLLVSVVIANFNGSQATSQRNVVLGTDNLVSDLHKLQSYSLSSRNVAVSNGQINPAASYTASFSTGSTSYAMTDQDDKQPANSGTISSPNLPVHVAINAIQIVTPSGTVNPSSASVNFSVPYDRISATYNSVSNELNDVVRLQIQSTINSTCEYVYINGITGNINTNTVCP